MRGWILGNAKFRPAPLPVKYVEAGWLGRKVERGFHDYSGAVPVPRRQGSRPASFVAKRLI